MILNLLDQIDNMKILTKVFLFLILYFLWNSISFSTVSYWIILQAFLGFGMGIMIGSLVFFSRKIKSD